VVAPTQDVRIEPSLDEYSVGDVINCSASGWPAPQITWRHVSGPIADGSRAGQTLNIVEEMRGETNIWRCIAMNNFGTEEMLISFNVSRKSKQGVLISVNQY